MLLLTPACPVVCAARHSSCRAAHGARSHAPSSSAPTGGLDRPTHERPQLPVPVAYSLHCKPCPPQVVMGSHMSGGLMQFMLGSVASYVAHHCKQPVAVLH